MLLIILVVCVVCFLLILFVFVLCLVYAAILPVSLECLFLIDTSIYSNVSYKTRFSLANIFSKTHN